MNKIDRLHSQKQKRLNKALRRLEQGRADGTGARTLGVHGREFERIRQDIEHPAGKCQCLACRKARGTAD